MAETLFSKLSDDVILNILFKLEDDPRDWAWLVCSCTKFSSMIRNVCWKIKCYKIIPSIVSDLLTGSTEPAGGWAALRKLAVCCPGLLHSGVIFENSDFGLKHELGPDENYQRLDSNPVGASPAVNPPTEASSSQIDANQEIGSSANDCSWSLFDDLYFDTVYNDSKAHQEQDNPQLESAAADDDQVTVENGIVRVGRGEGPDLRHRRPGKP